MHGEIRQNVWKANNFPALRLVVFEAVARSRIALAASGSREGMRQTLLPAVAAGPGGHSPAGKQVPSRDTSLFSGFERFLLATLTAVISNTLPAHRGYRVSSTVSRGDKSSLQHRSQVQVPGKRSLLALKTLACRSKARVLEFLPELVHFGVGLHHSWLNQFFLPRRDVGQL